MPRKGKNKKITITSELSNLRLVRQFISKEAKKFGFNEIEAEKIILAVDEVCTNSIKHSYKNKPSGKIDIEIKSQENKFIVIVSYDGIPFKVKKMRIESPVEKYIQTKKAKRGKLGMYIIHKFMDEVKYLRVKGKNTVMLTKIFKTENNEKK